MVFIKRNHLFFLERKQQHGQHGHSLRGLLPATRGRHGCRYAHQPAGTVTRGRHGSCHAHQPAGTVTRGRHGSRDAYQPAGTVTRGRHGGRDAHQPAGTVQYVQPATSTWALFVGGLAWGVKSCHSLKALFRIHIH